MTITVAQANAVSIPLADESVHVCVCSPPYFGARKYEGAQDRVWGGDPTCEHIWDERVRPGMTGGVGEKSPGQGSGTANTLKMFSSSQHAFCQKCGAWRGALGLEPHVDMFIANLVEIFREVKRTLHKTGTLWVVISDSYVGSGQGWSKSGKQTGNVGSLGWTSEYGYERPPNYISSPQPNGLKPGDLFGVPWRLGMALQRDGWWLRSAIIWAKSVSFCPTYVGSCMPESVRDRPTKSHEYVLLLSKSRKYYYDIEGVAEPLTQSTLRDRRTRGGRHGVKSGKYVERGDNYGHNVDTLRYGDRNPVSDVTKGRNLRSVWLLGSSRGTSIAHYATFPCELVEPCIKAGTSEYGVCGECSNPYTRVENDWQPTCECDCSEVRPAVVLDPFAGSCTTGVVCKKLGRDFVGLDLSHNYLSEFGRERLGMKILEEWEARSGEGKSLEDLPMFAGGEW